MFKDTFVKFFGSNKEKSYSVTPKSCPVALYNKYLVKSIISTVLLLPCNISNNQSGALKTLFLVSKWSCNIVTKFGSSDKGSVFSIISAGEDVYFFVTIVLLFVTVPSKP